MGSHIEIVGVYPIPGTEEPVVLIELWVKEFHGKCDFGAFGQEIPELEPADEQVAYDEHLLTDDGTSGRRILFDPYEVSDHARFAFFLHYLDASRPIKTPFGPVSLPPPTRRPERLAFIRYCQP